MQVFLLLITFWIILTGSMQEIIKYEWNYQEYDKYQDEDVFDSQGPKISHPK